MTLKTFCNHGFSNYISVNALDLTTPTHIKMYSLLQVGVNNVVLPTVNNVVNIEQACAAPSEQCCQQGCSAKKNNVVSALFNYQYCYNLLTKLSNNDNNNEQACSINIVFSFSNNYEQPLLLHQCRTTLLKQ